MLFTLVLLFTVLPLAELFLLYKLGQEIGVLPTIAIALGTGVLGASLARAQGMATLAKISQQLRAKEAPTDALFDGALILLAGFLLITPGVITDVTGFLLLVPLVRTFVKPLLRRWLSGRGLRGGLHRQDAGPKVRVWTFGSTIGPPPPQKDRVIEAEVIDVRTRDAE